MIYIIWINLARADENEIKILNFPATRPNNGLATCKAVLKMIK
jgi:hypothetical protein